MYFASTAVVVCELLKLTVSTWLLMREETSDLGVVDVLRTKVLGDPIDFLMLGVPAGLYVVQNNLAYIATSHLDAATYQLLYQLKILTTAIFSVFLLNKRVNLRQWGSLVLLVIGVGLVQTSSVTAAAVTDDEQRNAFLGLAAVLAACCLSGLAGVYFEKMLKHSKASLWARNIQLSLYGVVLGLLPVWNDWPSISETGKGFFVGYSCVVWSVVLLQAGGGLLVAMVVKYADNILKGFATSLSILFSCTVSYFLFNFQINAQFATGAACVLSAAYFYGSAPPSAASKTPTSPAAATDEAGPPPIAVAQDAEAPAPAV